jgi:hypothetical protein
MTGLPTSENQRDIVPPKGAAAAPVQQAGDRRRPGRIEVDNPDLIQLMRGQVPAPPEPAFLAALEAEEKTVSHGSLRPLIFAGLIFWLAVMLFGSGF